MTTPERHFQDFLEALGLSAEKDPELAETPRRVSELLADLTASAKLDPPQLSTFPAQNHETVIVEHIEFRSMCVHHMLPFFGTIDIAYIPDARLAGFGGFLRAVEYVSRKPQVQERLVQELADILQDALSPKGLLIRCQARQMCVEMRRDTIAKFTSFASTGELSGGPERESVLNQLAQRSST
ncbi:GTP cyclohydrolase I [Microvenator marinus]|uniref:GTP cyclohydrolase I n=1 Tax=Microvenator marinus TaxID=2600177 RepID=UPI00201B93F5|nr:GTP cyclohydrolase I [Microvenator marinus]